MRTAIALLALPILMSCDRNPDKPTVEESRQLDDASNLLNQAPASLERVDEHGLDSINTENGNRR